MNFDLQSIFALKSQLDETGYANDEQFLGAFAFEHRTEEIMEDLRQVGYSAELTLMGDFFPQSGAIYWLFDQRCMTIEEARRLTEEWSAQTSMNGASDE